MGRGWQDLRAGRRAAGLVVVILQINANRGAQGLRVSLGLSVENVGRPGIRVVVGALLIAQQGTGLAIVRATCNETANEQLIVIEG